MIHSRKDADCVLWGGYAWGNVGDELTLAIAWHDAHRKFAGNVTVLSRNPAITSLTIPAARVVRYAPRRPPRVQRELWRLLRRWQYRMARLQLAHYRVQDQSFADLWVQTIQRARELWLVGGGYLNDLGPCEYFLLPVQLAKAAGVSVRTAPVGIGPFRSSRTADLVATALRGTDLTVRDKASEQWCVSHQLRSQLRRDDGYRVREVMPELAQIPAAAMGRTVRIGVCIHRQQGDPDWSRTQLWWTVLLRQLWRVENSVAVEGFCFHTAPEADQCCTRHLLRASGWRLADVEPRAADFRGAVRRVAGFDAVISARFHAVVVAAALGIPAVAIGAGEYYWDKMQATRRCADPARDAATDVTGRLLRRLNKRARVSSWI